MPFAKGAVSRHMIRRVKKAGRVKQFGSRRKYRAAKRSQGGKGGSW